MGLYRVVEGDHIAFRYQVIQECGRGAFGQVIKCLDHKTGRIVAIKLVRNDPGLAKSAKMELQILKMVTEAQSPDIINLVDQFKYRGHYVRLRN